jgi:hypothetical protein
MHWSRHRRSGGSSTGTGFAWSSALLIPVVVLTLSSLQGCSNRLGAVVIDPRLTAPCEQPVLRGTTYRDAIVLGVERGEALEECADRMDEIRGLTR